MIVLTHQHLDHLGLTELLVARSGAEVAAYGRLRPWLDDFSGSMVREDDFTYALMLRHGVAPDVATALRGVSEVFRAFGSRATVTVPLDDGDELKLRDRAFEIHHRPGHSPSDIVLHDRAQKVLLSGDHLIKDTSSNPLIARPIDGSDENVRPRQLPVYVESLQATQAMEHVELVLCGHGEPIVEPVALIDRRLAAHERRLENIHGILADRSLTAHEIARDMWGDIAVTQTYLTLSEVLGHLDLLADRGMAAEDDSCPVTRFTAT